MTHSGSSLPSTGESCWFWRLCEGQGLPRSTRSPWEGFGGDGEIPGFESGFPMVGS